MSSDVSRFLQEGAKNGRYAGWATRPRCCFANDSVATLEVGNKDSGIRIFHVHESILCELDFFKAALKGGFKEASSKLIKMPEDDPIFMECFVEFLYGSNYQEPIHSVPEGRELPLDYKYLFMRGLYHARVVVLGEKYSFEELYNKAARNMSRLGIYINPGAATTANDVDFLEYIVQLYEMSGPSSVLRIPKTNDTVRSSTTKPIVWDAQTASRWVGRMWRDSVQKPLLKEAFKRCPDLAEDLLLMIASGRTPEEEITLPKTTINVGSRILWS